MSFKKTKVKNVLICSGGTAGHLFPALDLASRLQKSSNVYFAGHKISQSPFFYHKFPCFDIYAAQLSFKGILSFFYKTLLGFYQALKLLIRLSPDYVVGFGSYHTFPLMLASVFLRKKIVLFEANCSLGKVNRFFAPFAKKVAIQFPLNQPLKNSIEVSKLPWGIKVEEKITKEQAACYFGLDENRFTILVFGGSQGASFLNHVIPNVLKRFSDIQVLHFSGKEKPIYEGVNACVKEFESRMDLAYTLADIVICRSGAGTISELISYKKPALLIPFPFATDNHQEANAIFMTHQIHGSLYLTQAKASEENIYDSLQRLISEREEFVKKMMVFDLQTKASIESVCHEI